MCLAKDNSSLYTMVVNSTLSKLFTTYLTLDISPSSQIYSERENQPSNNFMRKVDSFGDHKGSIVEWRQPSKCNGMKMWNSAEHEDHNHIVTWGAVLLEFMQYH